MSPYYAQMTNLPEKNHRVYEAFKAGQFSSVQMSNNSNPFGSIPVDQATEVTVNKDTKTPGGTARFSLTAAAIKRYYITSEYRSALLGQLRDMVQGNRSNVCHTELQRPRIHKNESLVSSILGQPICGEAGPLQHLYCKDRYATVNGERLERDLPANKFHDPMKTIRLKTFSNMCKKKELKSSGRTLNADRSLFGRIIVMAQGRNLQMDDILSHPLGPLPCALTTADGLLRKNNKAFLAATFQKNVKVAEQLPGISASVIDGMNVVKRVSEGWSSYFWRYRHYNLVRGP